MIISVWVNGNLAGWAQRTDGGSMQAGGYNITLGASQGSNGEARNWAGQMDNLKIWNEARDQVPEPSFMGIALLALLKLKRK